VSGRAADDVEGTWFTGSGPRTTTGEVVPAVIIGV
jgi:hypothetical protein